MVIFFKGVDLYASEMLGRLSVVLLWIVASNLIGVLFVSHCLHLVDVSLTD